MFSAYPNKKLKIRKQLLLNFSKSILLSHYTHIGFKKSLLHQSFRKAIYGFHNNIAVIDPSLTLACLRLATRFLFSLMLRNQKVCFVLFNIPDPIKKNLNLYGNYHLINNWPGGLITNFRTAKTSKKLSRYGYFPFVPSAVSIFDAPSEKIVEIVNETKKFFIPSFSFVDSNVNLSYFPYWIPTNTKSGFSKLFFIKYFGSLSKKVFLTKKYFFNKKVRKRVPEQQNKKKKIQF